MSQCLGKQPYESKELAERAAEIYTNNSKAKVSNTTVSGKKSYGHGLTYRAYRCNICRKFHLTSMPKKRYKKQ